MSNAKLQRLINKCAAANSAFFRAQNDLNEYCQEHYGSTPSDLDCDDVIDALLGVARCPEPDHCERKGSVWL